MTFLDRLRRRLTRQPATPQPRTLSGPSRVNLADHTVHDDHVVHLKDWSSFAPPLPAWELPPADQQREWVERLIAAHAASGDLDGLVPDLVDRPIHDEMDELRQIVRDSHTQALNVEQFLVEQARAAESRVRAELAAWRAVYSEHTQGYDRAYVKLTGQQPRRDIPTPTTTA